MWIETINEKDEPKLAAVAPHAGVWIETHMDKKVMIACPGRAPRGRVD